MSGYSAQSDFMDPMCGSGTLLIEAAMIAANIPANLNRDVFGFESWRDFDVDLYETIEEALIKRIREVPVKIMGMDRDMRTLSKAKANIKAANLSDFIQVEHRDFFGSEKPSDRYWHLVFNPPYDERLSLDDVAEFYGNIGNTLKRGYPGSQAWLITSNEEALKSVGLRPSKKIKVYNGKLPAKFVQYSMYQGSKKASKQ
ncbi:MAG TPA: RNA methyltransferase, partial [Flavobacteriaceae bacterium]|nr:RNA methyltransferase [Flavobacteriaceae bacterium]